MRNIFDQYNQPENRLTHSLAVALREDRALLKSFLKHFGPEKHPDIRNLRILEQGLPGSIETNDEEEAERRGLPDAAVFTEDGWALVIESKIMSSLTKDQLQRHYRTIERCGLDDIHGLAITVDPPSFALKGWRMATWKDVYAWANDNLSSPWAKHMVDYFNVAEDKMAQKEYLTEGTITEFSGINIDPYTYLEGKRVLRLLTDKIRKNKSFMKEMNLDPVSRRPAITNDREGVWDFVSFKADIYKHKNFTGYPHCTFGISEKDKKATAMITFPNAMRPGIANRLVGDSYDDFSSRLEDVLASIRKNLKGVKGYKPVLKVVQRHYKTQRSAAVTDGELTVDLRACFGGKDDHTGRSIRKQEQWLRAIHELLSNKHSNIQFQIGIYFSRELCADLKKRDADRVFMASLRALKPFIKDVLAGA